MPPVLEKPKEAAALDDKIIAAWTGHLHFRVIDNSTYCLANHVYYVFKGDRIFYDLTTGKRFKIDYEDVPGSADDAATYYDYKRIYLD